MIRLFRTIKREFAYTLGLGYAPPAESVTIEMNYNCMFRCQMCQLWTQEFKTARTGDNKIITEYKIKEIIDELCSLGVKSIYFCGGEPFLRKDFLTIVTHCKIKGLYCSTISNGYLIDSALAEQIVLSGIDLVGISLDSAKKELHDELRGTKGAFDHAVEGIRLIKKQQKKHDTPLPAVFINTTISSRNFSVLPEIVDLAKSLGVKKIHFNYLSTVDQNIAELSNRFFGEKIIGFHTFSDISQEFLLQEDQIHQLKSVLDTIKKHGGSEVACDLDPALLSGNKDLLLKGKFPVLRCNIPWRSAMITPLGDVVPCAMFTNYKMGNLREASFREIRNNKPQETYEVFSVRNFLLYAKNAV